MSLRRGCGRRLLACLAVLALWLAPLSAAASDAERIWRLEADLTCYYGFMPKAFLDRYFDVHGRLHGVGPGVELAWTRHGFHAIAVFQTNFITMPDQVWLEKGDPITQAKWMEADLALLSMGVIFAYEIPLFGKLSVMPGIGFVPIYLKGEMLEYRTDGGPDTPVEDRKKVEALPGTPIKLPQQFKGNDLQLRLRLRPRERFFLSADFGWRMVLYSGLAVGISV